MLASPEAIPPLLSVAAGCAAGMVYLWKAPARGAQDEEAKWFRHRLERLEAALAEEEARSDHLRRKLNECKMELARITDVKIEPDEHEHGPGRHPG